MATSLYLRSPLDLSGFLNVVCLPSRLKHTCLLLCFRLIRTHRTRMKTRGSVPPAKIQTVEER